MKKSIITAMLVIVTGLAMGQKKVYQPNLNQKVTLQVSVNAYDLNNFMAILQMGGPQAVTGSKTLTGDKITLLMGSYQAIIDSLNKVPAKAWYKFYKDGEKKWAADTLAKAKKGGVK